MDRGIVRGIVPAAPIPKMTRLPIATGKLVCTAAVVWAASTWRLTVSYDELLP